MASIIKWSCYATVVGALVGLGTVSGWNFAEMIMLGICLGEQAADHGQDYRRPINRV